MKVVKVHAEFRYLLIFSVTKKKVSTEIEGLMVIRKDKLGTFSGQIIMFFIITKKAMGDAFKTFSFTSCTSVHRDLENKDKDIFLSI